MKTKHFLLLLLLSLSGFAQNEDIKKHKNDLRHATADSLVFRALIDLSWDYSIFDTDSARYFAHQSETVLKKLKRHRYALRYQINLLEAHANIQYKKGNYAKALELYVDCLKLAETGNLKLYNAYALLIVGEFAEDLDDHENAIMYLRRSEKIFHELKKSKGYNDEVLVFNRIGKIYTNLGKTDSALYYFQKSYAMGQKIKLRTGEFAFAHYGLGSVHHQLKNHDIAKSYYLKAADLALAEMDKPSDVPNTVLSNSNKGLAEIYNQAGDTKNARLYYEKIVATSADKDKIMLAAYQNLAEMTKYRENDKAVLYFDKATQLRDSLYSAQTQKDFQRILYKERERETKRAEAERKAREQEHILIQYAAIALVIVCFLVGLILLNRTLGHAQTDREKQTGQTQDCPKNHRKGTTSGSKSTLIFAASKKSLCLRKRLLMEPLKPNEQRGKTAVAMIWIMLSLYILMGISNYFEYRLLSSAIDGEIITTEAASANDSRQQLLAIVLIVAHVVAAITFIQWFRRAYFNLHLRAETLSFTEGWAAGSWFVPFMNLVRPYQIMQELYVETFALLDHKPGRYPERFSTQFLGWWWALWILNGVVDRLDLRYGMKAETVEEFANSSIIGMVSCGLGIPLAFLAVKVISDYIKMEKLLAFQDSEIPTGESRSEEIQNPTTEIVTTDPLL